jgi:pimeloyl-ACP methyl ester carboxylesterase
VRSPGMSGAPEGGLAEVNGASLYYDVASNGEPLVFVHAGIADHRMWDGQVEAFAERYRVVRYDMRGYGRSEAPVGAPFSHHDDLRGLLDFLFIERAILVGCSIGARTVIDFALAHPERVRVLALVCPTVSGFESDEEPPEEWDELVAADEAGDLERVSELEVRIWVDGPYRRPDNVDPAVRNLVGEMNLIALRNEPDLGEERPAEPPAVNRLAEIQAPTLVVAGALDRPEVGARAELLGEIIPRTQKIVINGTAHVPSMEKPEEFNRVVMGFLSEVSGAG